MSKISVYFKNQVTFDSEDPELLNSIEVRA